MDEQKTSPLPRPVLDLNYPPMTFPQAIEQVIAGKKVTRDEWENNEEYVHLKDGWLMIRLKGADYQLIVSDGDLLASDWTLRADLN